MRENSIFARFFRSLTANIRPRDKVPAFVNAPTVDIYTTSTLRGGHEGWRGVCKSDGGGRNAVSDGHQGHTNSQRQIGQRLDLDVRR